MCVISHTTGPYFVRKREVHYSLVIYILLFQWFSVKATRRKNLASDRFASGT